jgi:hypothetical protein
MSFADFFTTRDAAYQVKRLSVEKTITALTILVSSAIGVADAFGWVEPTAAAAMQGHVTTVSTRILGSLVEAWPLLLLLSALWHRKRSQQDASP